MGGTISHCYELHRAPGTGKQATGGGLDLAGEHVACTLCDAKSNV